MEERYIVVIHDETDGGVHVSKHDDRQSAQELVAVARSFGDTATTLIIRDRQFAIEGP
jgi:hypothetical protein